jgi:branched-chain amino acid aminotransferase
MIVFLNGEFVPDKRAVVSVFDRAFLYGDGLFETVPIFNGKPFRWKQHLERLQRGADFLKIRLPFAPEALFGFVEQLVVRNQMQDSLLRLTLSRGVGVRGYSPKGAECPSVVMSLHPAPTFNPQKAPGWRLITSSFRLPANERLAQFKTCNKLAQILARAEADAAGAEEALLLNTAGVVVEATSSNLFWIADGVIWSPPLASGILAGVTRELVFEQCQKLGLPVNQGNVSSSKLQQAQGIFLSLSSTGIAEGLSLDGKELDRSPLVGILAKSYWDLVRTESEQVRGHA